MLEDLVGTIVYEAPANCISLPDGPVLLSLERKKAQAKGVGGTFLLFFSDLQHSYCLIRWEMQVVSNDQTPLLNITSCLSSTSLATIILYSHHL